MWFQGTLPPVSWCWATTIIAIPCVVCFAACRMLPLVFLPRLALLPTLSFLPPSCAPVLPAPQIVAHLEDLLQEPRAPQAALDDAHLSASALLAVEQHRFASTELGQRLLKDLCSAPLQRLTPATVKLAMFSWAWVSGGGGWVVKVLERGKARQVGRAAEVQGRSSWASGVSCCCA